MGNYNQFSIEERSVIQAQLTLGVKPSWIAVGLGRSVSTISRASLQWVSKRETWAWSTGDCRQVSRSIGAR